MANGHDSRRDSRYPLKQRTVCKMIRKLFDQVARTEDTFFA